MRLGIFGGTFDPIHLGHLLLAESCREQASLDEVWFIPCAVQPHKQGRDVTPVQKRLEMIELAIAGQLAFRASNIEAERGGVSYTVETLRSVKDKEPNSELFLLLGADALADLPNWREPEAICRLAKLVTVSRAGQPCPDFSPLQKFTSPDQIAEFQKLQVTMPQQGISATDLRHRVATGKSIRFQTPRAVEEYIRFHELYR
jgi:nicotinate-nucleotide adenylyltransferase